MFDKWKKKQALKKAELEYDEAHYKLSTKLLKEATEARTTPIADPDEKNWMSHGTDYAMTEEDHGEMLENAFKLYHNNTHAKAMIRTLVKYTLGKGPQVIPKDGNEKAKEVWDNFKEENNFNHREKEIATRLFRDGEVFNRLFKARSNKEGLVTIRFIRALNIRVPVDRIELQKKASFGIETARNDVEEIIAYYRCKNDGNFAEKIDAENVIHLKINSDSDQKRGISSLRVVAKRLRQYDDWIEDRIVLNKVRSAIALVAKYDGSSSKIRSLRDEGLSDRLTGDKQKQKSFQRGTFIRTGKGTEYQMLSANINATDVKDDGRAMLLSVAAAAGMPEMVFTSDYSNANFASTQIAQNPFVREIEDWQDFFITFYKRLYKIVIQNAIDHGPLPDKTSTVCDVVFPPIILAELGDLAKAYETLHKYKVVSKRTWAYNMGHDYNIEKGYMEDEEEDEILPGIPGAVPGKPTGTSQFNMPVAPINQFGHLMEAIAKKDWEKARSINAEYFNDSAVANMIDVLEQKENDIEERNSFTKMIDKVLEEMGKVHKNITETTFETAKGMTEAIIESIGNIKFENVVNTPDVDVKAGDVIINQEPPIVNAPVTVNNPKQEKPEVKVNIENKMEEPKVTVTPKIDVRVPKQEKPEVKVNIENKIEKPEVKIENVVKVPKHKIKKTVNRNKKGVVESIIEEAVD